MPLNDLSTVVDRYPRKQTAQEKQLSLQHVVRQAFDEVGGVDYLVHIANKYPKVFVSLLSKCMPQTLDLPANSAIKIEIVRFSDDKKIEDIL